MATTDLASEFFQCRRFSEILFQQEDDLFDTYGFLDSEFRAKRNAQAHKIRAAVLSIYMPFESIEDRLNATGDEMGADGRTIRRWSDEGLRVIAARIIEEKELTSSSKALLKMSAFYPSEQEGSVHLFFTSYMLKTVVFHDPRVELGTRPEVSDQKDISKDVRRVREQESGAFMWREYDYFLKLPDPADYEPGQQVLYLGYFQNMVRVPIARFSVHFFHPDFLATFGAYRQQLNMIIDRKPLPPS